jgi:hypothetical protein
MTREEFKAFVEKTIEEVILFAESETKTTLPRKIAFQWFHQKTEPIREGISDVIADRVYIDAEHIYPCVDIGVGDVLPDHTVLLVANVAGYSARPFQRNWTGRDGPFVYIIGQKFLDKSKKSQPL